MAKDAPKPPDKPERTAVTIEHKGDGLWTCVTLRIRGDSVVSRTESERDAFSECERRARLTLMRLRA